MCTDLLHIVFHMPWPFDSAAVVRELFDLGVKKSSLVANHDTLQIFCYLIQLAHLQISMFGCILLWEAICKHDTLVLSTK